MPKEIHSAEQFQQIIPKAQECRVVRSPSGVKLKLRTPEHLYTYSTNEKEAEDLIKSLKNIEVAEFTPKEKESQKKEKSEKKKKVEEKE